MGRNNSGNRVYHKANPPFKAYNGNKPYIFVSYKHKDAGIVYPIIKKFHDMGFNIWYDEGLPYGENFDIVIPEKIEGATLFINFITQTCMECANDSEDYMVKESDIAKYLEVPILAIYPEPEEFRLRGYYLTNYLKKQSLYWYDYGDDDIFIERCVEVIMSNGLEPAEMNKAVPEVDDVPIADESSFQPHVDEINPNGSFTSDSRPCPAYGSEQYIFLSYAHKDSNRVFPEIKRFNDLGYNVWYDEGIMPGSEWADEIENALLKSSLFVVFLSDSAVESVNVRNEIFLAFRYGIPVLPICLEETKLKYGLSLSLMSSQSILKYQMSDEEYVQSVTNAFKKHGIN